MSVRKKYFIIFILLFSLTILTNYSNFFTDVIQTQQSGPTQPPPTQEIKESTTEPPTQEIQEPPPPPPTEPITQQTTQPTTLLPAETPSTTLTNEPPVNTLNPQTNSQPIPEENKDSAPEENLPINPPPPPPAPREISCLEMNIIEEQCKDQEYLKNNIEKFKEEECIENEDCSNPENLERQCLEYSGIHGPDKNYWLNVRKGMNCEIHEYLFKTYGRNCSAQRIFTNTAVLKTICRKVELEGVLPKISVKQKAEKKEAPQSLPEDQTKTETPNKEEISPIIEDEKLPSNIVYKTNSGDTALLNKTSESNIEIKEEPEINNENNETTNTHQDIYEQKIKEFEQSLNESFGNIEKIITEKQKELEAKLSEIAEKKINELARIEKIKQEKINDINISEVQKQIEKINQKAEVIENKIEEIQNRERKREIMVPRELKNDVEKSVVDLAEKMNKQDGYLDVIIDFKDLKLNASQLAIISRSSSQTTNLGDHRAVVKFTPEQFQNYLSIAPIVSKEQKIQRDYDLRLWLDTSSTYIGSTVVQSDMGFTGKNIKVAVLDTGIEQDFPGLKDRVIDAIDFTGEGVGDKNGHGTHVACIIGCNDKIYKGNAPGVEILDVKVMKSDGSGKMSYAIDGIEWAIEKGANIINISLGAKIDLCDGTDLLSEAVNEAVEKGIVVITAAGNFGPDAETVSAPGCSEKSLTVGAVNENKEIALFSSIGPTADGRIKPDIYAPGVDITSGWIDGTYAIVNGTSQAAPHVAAVAALLLEANPSLTPEDIKNILVSTATPITNQEQGIVDAYNALYLYSSIKKTDIVANQNTAQKKPRKKISMAERKISVHQQAVQNTRNAREELKLCRLGARDDEEIKKDCLQDFLKKQIKNQKERLTSEEKEKIKIVQQNAIKINELSKNAGDNEDIFKKIASTLYFSAFSGPSLQEMADKSSELIRDIETKNPILSSKIKQFIKLYQQKKDESIIDGYIRGLIPFKDIGENTWYFSYIEDVKNRGIINGYKDENGNPTGFFGPENPLTIAEAVKIFLESAKIKPSISLEPPQHYLFTKHWAEKYLQKCEELNLSLFKNADLDPNRYITREEVATFLMEIFKLPQVSKIDPIFKDVNSNSNFAENIYSIYALGIVSGDHYNNTFRPYDQIARAEMAKIIIETLQLLSK
ncbi:MAG: Subtilisin-like protein serine protease [Candidatus Peregrinibacteria bacterium GW2011_GWA2_33_10]|nr:MAG: Subtilisin-like protein serine protease [Candidatus Peregrinibacteria bacterium GW2011_GWA2_33_10]OGJ50737.1 MAG: hypothetical protein A2229_02680 [Candidatus Peregrinibacteria bacterium RIFOXYA2_FULL_33_7]